MVKMFLSTAFVVCCLCSFGFSLEEGTGSKKILIAYYSRTNNTAAVAREIQSRVGGDLFQVETQQAYPADYRETTEVASVELKDNARPALARTISKDEMAKYDVIFVGYPIWWGTMPMAMFTFLEQFDLSGKIVIPFCTHGGSGIARSPADIAKLAPNSTISEGLAIRSDSVGQAAGPVSEWLRQLGM